MSRKILLQHIDWVLLIAIIPLLLSGLITMRSFGGPEDYFFSRQVLWIIFAFIIFFSFSFIDWRFLKRGEWLLIIYLLGVSLLIFLLLFGKTIRGTTSWIHLGVFAVEPSDPIKIILILLLAKYFSRRHIEIANFRHIFVSGVYAFIPTALIFFQPDFGSALVLFLIWLGMVLVSGISKQHLLLVFLVATLVFLISWLFIFEPYQKERILSFLHPLKDIRGSGYNAYQSMVAIGSGQVFGKGIGFGTQSRLNFLPEHQTDFIFAAFAEEWGFIGVVLLFVFYAIVIWRILKIAYFGQSNFEAFFGIGLAILLISHFVIHVGMNIGLLPITGITLPFVSYGGSNLITIFAALGMLMGMKRYSYFIPRQSDPDAVLQV